MIWPQSTTLFLCSLQWTSTYHFHRNLRMTARYGGSIEGRHWFGNHWLVLCLRYVGLCCARVRSSCSCLCSLCNRWMKHVWSISWIWFSFLHVSFFNGLGHLVCHWVHSCLILGYTTQFGHQNSHITNFATTSGLMHLILTSIAMMRTLWLPTSIVGTRVQIVALVPPCKPVPFTDLHSSANYWVTGQDCTSYHSIWQLWQCYR